ncbi:MAG: tripartite tricarboxylate transporter substrate binding protein [Firmicutes bacterium]|nr:tripartite tricarboxylate transporter substrate binding protein [Bacillota bacterium]
MKRKMNLFLVSLLCVLMVFTLIGCGNTGGGTSGEPEPTTDFPNKSIEMIVPWGAGGGVDVTARVFAPFFEKYLGQTVVVQNVTGGGGSVALTQVANATPDGYTCTMSASPMINHKYTVEGVTYDYTSFIPIGMVTYDPLLLIVKTGSDFDKPWDEIVAYAKDNPGKILYAVGSLMGSHDMARVQLEMATGLSFQKVAFSEGGGDTVTNLLGGHVDMGTAYYSECASQLEDGTLKAIWVASADRSEFAPDIPTLKELGTDIELGTWRGVFVPAGTPDDVVAILRDAFEKTIVDPEFLEELNKHGNAAIFMSADDFYERLKEETESIGQVCELLKAE